MHVNTAHREISKIPSSKVVLESAIDARATNVCDMNFIVPKCYICTDGFALFS